MENKGKELAIDSLKRGYSSPKEVFKELSDPKHLKRVGRLDNCLKGDDRLDYAQYLVKSGKPRYTTNYLNKGDRLVSYKADRATGQVL